MKKTFKEIVDEIREKYLSHGLYETFIDYITLCVMDSFVEGLDDKNLKANLKKLLQQVKEEQGKKIVSIEDGKVYYEAGEKKNE